MLRQNEADLQQLPLGAFHRHHGSRLIPFAGFEMPLCYADGILKEHLHTRASASLFDVSHMGQLLVQPGDSGDWNQVALALESVLPADVVSLAVGRQCYSVLTTTNGGILDDLMIVRLATGFLLVVNGATKYQDERYLRDRLTPGCRLELLSDRALLALQGPHSAEVLSSAAPVTSTMRFMDVLELKLRGLDCWVMRSGYTGEDGFEISVGCDAVADVADRLLSHPAVRLAGLGARDSLRLEAGLCLYGTDIDGETTPIQAGLAWAIPASRRPGGARPGGFPGADRMFHEIRTGPMTRRVGVASEQRPVRGNAALFADDAGDQVLGRVTSGGFGPSVHAPVAMGYVDSSHAIPGRRLFAQVGHTRVPVMLAKLPFVAHRYRR